MSRREHIFAEQLIFTMRLSFRLVSFPIRLGAYSWICARAAVNPGVNVGEGAILALGPVATKDLEPFGIYAGSRLAR